MNIYTLSSFMAWISVFLIGLFVLFKNKQNKLNRYFFYSCITLCAWIIGCFMQSLVHTKHMAVVWDTVLYTGIALNPSTYLLFTLTFLDLKKKKIICASFFISFLFLIINYAPQLRSLLVTDVSQKYIFRFISSPGVLWYGIVVFNVVSVFYAGFYLGYKKYKVAIFNERNQLKYFFIAQGIIGIAGSMYFLLVCNVATPPIDNLLAIIYASIMAYAIIRYQLMDIEVIIKKTLVFAGLFAASYAVFTGFAYLGSIIFENFVQNKWIAMVPSTAVIVLILRPLENFLRNTTDKFLFQKKYDYRELLKTFTDEVLTVLKISNLVDITVRKLMDIVKLNSASIFLYNKDSDKLILSSSVGLGEESKKIDCSGSLFFGVIKNIGSYVLKENVKDNPKDINREIAKEMDNIKAEMLIPLYNNDEILGILSLGAKKSDEGFTQDDISILLPLAKTLTIAVTNAQLLEKLMLAQAQAAQREKMAVIGTLAAGMNHEICNPLGIVRGQCELFLLNFKEGFYNGKDPKEIIEKAKAIMQKVIQETDRATGITKRLSSFAKPAKGEIEENVDIEKEVDEVISLLEQDLRLSDIVIKKDFQEDLPGISADRKQVQEIFFNLIRNAAQAISDKGQITIKAVSRGSEVNIHIIDTGNGIKKSQMEQIFDPFFTTKDPGKGTGLGLFIVKQIVERNNGRISATSEVNKGTDFSLVFKASRSVERVV